MPWVESGGVPWVESKRGGRATVVSRFDFTIFIQVFKYRRLVQKYRRLVKQLFEAPTVLKVRKIQFPLAKILNLAKKGCESDTKRCKSGAKPCRRYFYLMCYFIRRF